MALGGDRDGDDAAAEAVWSGADAGGTWKPDCWSKHPDQMVAEARDDNIACHNHAAAHAGKHSNPPHNPTLRSV